MPDSLSAKEPISDKSEKDEKWAEWDKNQAAWKSSYYKGKRWLGVSGCYHVPKRVYE